MTSIRRYGVIVTYMTWRMGDCVTSHQSKFLWL